MERHPGPAAPHFAALNAGYGAVVVAAHFIR